MKLKPTRYEADIIIDEKPEYKSTGKVTIAMGIVGHTPAIAATPATETAPAIAAVESRPIWGIDIVPLTESGAASNILTMRKAMNPQELRNALANALRKIAAEIEQDPAL